MNREILLKYFYQIILLLLISTIISGCKDKIVDPPNEKKAAIYGKVVDQNGNALANVDVHYIYFLGDDVELRNATLSYGLPSPQNIILEIYDMDGKFIAKIIDQYQLAGQYMIFFNGDSLTNGIYHYKIRGQLFSEEGTFPLVTYNYSKLISTSPFKLSDSLGEFKIAYSVLGVGLKYQIDNLQNELVVADSIRFVLHKEGFHDLIETTKLDTTKVMEKTFKMIKNN